MLFAGFMLRAEDDIYRKLSAELNKYAVVYDKYDEINYPILSGNTAMGGLMDPLGRGIYNIEANDCQVYNLENGVLTTDAGYANGAFRSEMFFSQDRKDLMAYRLTNRGSSVLTCNIERPL